MTFQATGCPEKNPPNIAWWKTQSDIVVFDDMFSYCERVRKGTADERQKIKCCGHSDCTVTSCAKQDIWKTGTRKHILERTGVYYIVKKYFFILRNYSNSDLNNDFRFCRVKMCPLR